ncbi:MAG: polysaccharide deacetylase family protein [Congregibacter sp.]
MSIGTAVLLALAAGLAIWINRRYAWWRPTVDYRHPRILMYHMVSAHRPGAQFNKLRVTPESFETQIAYLQANGWRFGFMSELADLPEKSVVLTFDDGYADNLHHADVILQRYGAKATLYLVEDRFDRDWSTSKKAHHDSGELMQEPKLSDEEVRAMLASGRWELGGHTRTHVNLPRLDMPERRAEIAESRASLARAFGQAMLSFAYPFGIYGAEDVALVREAGFQYAVTTEEGIARDLQTQALELPRIKVSGKDSLLDYRLRLRTGKRSA